MSLDTPDWSATKVLKKKRNMIEDQTNLNRVDWRLWQRFWVIAKPYWFSEEKRGAVGLLGVLLVLALISSGIDVGSSFLGRNLLNALSRKDSQAFYHTILIFAGLFVLATPLVVFFPYVQGKLGLFWRRWLTKQFLTKYFSHRAYYQLNYQREVDNPEQRIQEDINSFTQGSLKFLLVVLTSVTTLIGFIGVLWSISVPLVFFLVGYAIVGNVITVWIGKRLIGLNYNQRKQEANFRYGLVHVRDYAESIAFYRGEGKEADQVEKRFDRAYLNYNRVIALQRNLGFFTQSYEFSIQIIPYLVVGALYFAGKTDLGAVSQAGDAFSAVFSSLNIIVDQFDDLSAFAAGVNRLALFNQTLDISNSPRPHPGTTVIDTVVEEPLALEHVTLQTPDYQKTLIKDLSVVVPPRQGLLIVGQSGTGKSSLLRVIAGLWNSGTGRLARPQLDKMLFLPQRPYMILGSLRDQLLYPSTEREISDEDLLLVLQQVNLADLPERVSGFDTHLDLANVLSLGEQQRLAFARLLLFSPQYAVLDEATGALDLKNEEHLYRCLQETGATYISVGHRSSLLKYHSFVLEILGDTRWRFFPAIEYNPNDDVLG